MFAGTLARILIAVAACASACAVGQNVKITSLGSHAGELCDRDRATLFEDPTGVRILFDAGQSVTGGDDPRLGEVHVVLLSHAHGDHIGNRRLKSLEAGFRLPCLNHACDGDVKVMSDLFSVGGDR